MTIIEAKHRGQWRAWAQAVDDIEAQRIAYRDTRAHPGQWLRFRDHSGDVRRIRYSIETDTHEVKGG